eukprot:m.652122 g.652122  ORF g.652122 m.652122 type:complete len:499 (+) comp22688_c0_seq3:205-1701(+)
MPVPQWQQLSRGNCNILVLTSIALRRNVTTPNLARRIVYFGRKEAVSRVSHSKRCYTACTIQDTASATVENDQHYDVCIIGGGVMGSSIAYWLRKLDNQVSVCVIERDATYTIASSALSVGSIRMQFSLAQNIRLSKFGVNFIKELANDPATNVAFDEGGYAFLASPGDGHDILKKNVALQRSLGAKIDTFEGESAIKAQFPWLNPSGIAMATLGRADEGWFDPYTLTTALKKKAIAEGVVFVNGNVVAFETDANAHIHGVTVATQQTRRSMTPPANKVLQLASGTSVLAAGCWSNQVLQCAIDSARARGVTMADADSILPVYPRKRQVFSFHCPHTLCEPAVPLLVDVSGFYVRRDGPAERGTYIAGGMEGKVNADPNYEGVRADLDVDHDYFTEHLWPRLAERIPVFNELKGLSSWAGFYDYNTFDQNAMLGKIPGFSNLLTCTGFSGHGVQQAPAAGLAVAEQTLFGEYRTLPDLDVFNADRVIENRPIREQNIV